MGDTMGEIHRGDTLWRETLGERHYGRNTRGRYTRGETLWETH